MIHCMQYTVATVGYRYPVITKFVYARYSCLRARSDAGPECHAAAFMLSATIWHFVYKVIFKIFITN